MQDVGSVARILEIAPSEPFVWHGGMTNDEPCLWFPQDNGLYVLNRLGVSRAETGDAPPWGYHEVEAMLVVIAEPIEIVALEALGRPTQTLLFRSTMAQWGDQELVIDRGWQLRVRLLTITQQRVGVSISGKYVRSDVLRGMGLWQDARPLP